MKLAQILSQVKTKFSADISEVEVSSVEIDSRLVKGGSVFFALPGIKSNGADFIDSAVSKGASAIVTSTNFSSSQVAVIKSDDVFALLVEFLQIFYAKLPQNIYAVTGTNGKSSVVEFVRQITEFLGKKSAALGTIGVNAPSLSRNLSHPPYQASSTNASTSSLNREDSPPALPSNLFVQSSLTTPDIVSFYKNLQVLAQNQIDDVAIEVSSIGLEQKRIAGLNIGVGAFTNFTQDHLDYHGDMNRYFAAKMILFSDVLGEGDCAVLNSDIPQFEAIKEICEKRKIKIFDYGFKAKKLKIESISQTISGQKISLKIDDNEFKFELSVSGEFQVYNVLCALGMVIARNELAENDLKQLFAKFLQLNAAEGRMQNVATLKNGARIFIDYAHTPDALENVLKTARNITKNRVLVLFGCGGDRDSKKRPLMGKIASDFADFLIVTEDNPRTENSAQIRREILQACDVNKTVEVEGRKNAIAKAISLLQENDVLILAGKGHEKYQILGTEKIDFDEAKIVLDIIRDISA